MKQQDERYYQLAQKWLDGTITEEEKKEFTEWYNSGQDTPLEIPGHFAHSEEELRQRLFKSITKNKNQGAALITFNISPLRKVVAACIIVVAGSVVLYLQTHFKNETHVAQKPIQRPKATIVPGGNKAVLVLADGSEVILDTAMNGTIAHNQTMRVIKLADGQLAYSSLKKSAAAISSNTLSTPRGGQYSITLSDGTKVWLNSASSLRFPTAFAGLQRSVELRGEAYFEVAKNPSQPFTVKVNDMEVQVLGTHFNVMAYEDEETIKTTLLEGAVRVQKNNANAFLKPGQQAQVGQLGAIRIKEDADVEKAIAWKNGLFTFEGATIESVMRQLQRWYNIEVVHQEKITDHFTGTISRNVGIDKVFQMLELTGAVHFTIKGTQVIVHS